MDPLGDLKATIEALIFASPDPLTLRVLLKTLDDEPREHVEEALAALRTAWKDRPGGLQLVEVAGGFQIVTRPELHDRVRRLFHEHASQRLSVQALETLAVIAYRQPVTGPEIAEIRGVNTSGVIGNAGRQASRQGHRSQGRDRAALPLCHHARVPRPVRIERPVGSAQGGGHGRGARHGSAPGSRRRPARGGSSLRDSLRSRAGRSARIRQGPLKPAA